MIKSIHIQNFRCFEDLKLEGLGRVNLIGGMNNSGKTVLLESFNLSVIQHIQTPLTLKAGRFLYQNALATEPNNIVWDDLFFNRDKSRKILAEATFENHDVLASWFEIHKYPAQSNENLMISYFNNNQEYFKGTIELEYRNGQFAQTKYLTEKFDENLKQKNKDIPVAHVLSKEPPSNQQFLVSSYSKFDIEGISHYILEGFHAIDLTIKEIKVISLNEPNLYLKRENEPLMPIELFGDAMRRVARITIAMLGARNGIVLIDEIENGVHYTNQSKIWELIFKLAQQFNVQVFATTHSKEMAQAFNQVALENNFENEAKYIEMARHGKTKKLIGMTMEMNILKHKLDYNKAFRGE